MAIWKTNWDKTFEAFYQVVNEANGEPYVMIQQGLSLEAYNPKNGVKQWSVQRESSSLEGDRVSTDVFIDLPVNAFDKEQESKWIMIGNELMRISLLSGDIKNLYTVKSGEIIFRISDQYLLIQKTLPHTGITERVETLLFDVSKEKELWTLPGRGSGGVLENEVLYMMLDGITIAVHLNDGQKIWEMVTTFPLDVQSNYLGDSLLILDEYIILPFAMRKADGVIEHRLYNVLFGYPDWYNPKRIRMINRDEHFIYAGSSNGVFQKIRIL